MATELANLCLRVGSTGGAVSCSGGTTYKYRVYWNQEDKPDLQDGSSATLSPPAAANCRVVFWDGDPGDPGEGFFDAPTYIKQGIDVGFSGGVNVTSCQDEPWPPT